MPASSRDDFQPIANPYIVGNPIEDENMFFGREDDFAYIRQKVTGGEQGGLLVLCGTRRSGKTSILFQIKKGRLGQEFVPVLIDMQAMTVQDDEEFLVKLAQEIVDTVGDPRLGEYEAELRTRAHRNPFSIFQALIAEINTVLAGRKLILMFDEYELFETHIDKGRFSTDVLNLLANWMESRQGVFIVFTGSDILESRNSRYWESFLGKALHRKISFLTESDTLRLICEPLQSKVEHAAGVPEAIYHLTAGQPFYSQVLCQSLIDHLNEDHKYEIAREDVEKAVEEIIENPLPQMIFTWSSLADLEKVSLSIIGERTRAESQPVAPEAILSFPKEEKLGYRLVAGKLNEALERLFHQDLLDKDKAGQSFGFKMDLWRRWTIRMHSIWQVVDEISAEGRQPGEGIKKDQGVGRRARWLALVALLLLAAASPFLYRLFERPEPTVVVQPAVPPAPAYLTVTTEPPGAEVLWGDLRLGEAPIMNRRVNADSLPLRIVLPGYKQKVEPLAVAEGESLRVTYTLEERRGGLRITSRPSGARVSLDGADLAQVTPAVVDSLLVSRRYQVRLSLAGYSAHTFAAVDIVEDSTVTLDHDFVRITHPLIILSKPLGATAYLDGEPLGTTPKTLPQVTEGSHRLRLSLNGHQDVSMNLTVPVRNNQVEVSLNPLPPGTLIISVEPFAQILINGDVKDRDAVYFEQSLPPGTYECVLVHPHYGRYATTVELRSGETRRLQHNFLAAEDQQ